MLEDFNAGESKGRVEVSNRGKRGRKEGTSGNLDSMSSLSARRLRGRLSGLREGTSRGKWRNETSLRMCQSPCIARSDESCSPIHYFRLLDGMIARLATLSGMRKPKARVKERRVLSEHNACRTHRTARRRDVRGCRFFPPSFIDRRRDGRNSLNLSSSNGARSALSETGETVGQNADNPDHV